MKNLKKCIHLHNPCPNLPFSYSVLLAKLFFKANYSSWTFLYLLLVVHLLFSSLRRNAQSLFLEALLYSLQSFHCKSFSYSAILCTGQCKILFIQMSCKFQMGICKTIDFSSICHPFFRLGGGWSYWFPQTAYILLG